MFVRSKKNASGKVSVQLIEKVGRVNRLVETLGCEVVGFKLSIGSSVILYMIFDFSQYAFENTSYGLTGYLAIFQ